MSTIKAIETTYAGCRFRSRLEARWAVFFDTLGIEWEYEPQGYVIKDRTYLPDFRIHALGISRKPLLVEVKGSADEFKKHQGRIWDAGTALETDVLILGPVPKPDTGHPPVKFVHRIFVASPGFGGIGLCAWHNATFTVGGILILIDSAEPFGRRFNHPYAIPEIEDAYAAARSARFEHGESGPPRE